MNLVDHINLAYDVAYDRFVGRDLALFLLGSWIPDIYVCGIFERAETHQGGKQFVDYCERRKPRITPLARGILFHQRVDDLFHDGYLEEKIDAVSRKTSSLDRTFFQKHAHGITELGGAFIEKTDISAKIKKALSYQVSEANTYFSFLGKSIKDRFRTSLLLYMAKLFCRLRLFSSPGRQINLDLIVNLFALTLNRLRGKRVFRNRSSLSALLMGSFYYLFTRERNLDNVERLRRLVQLAKDELEKDYSQYCRSLKDKLQRKALYEQR